MDWRWYEGGRHGTPPVKRVFGGEGWGALEAMPRLFVFMSRVVTRDVADGKEKFYPIGWRHLRKLLYNLRVEPRLVVLKARQLVATWSIAGSYLWEAMGYKNRVLIYISRRELEGVEWLKERVDFIYDRLPESWKGWGKMVKRYRTERYFESGSVIKVYPPLGASGRSVTGTRAVVDEAGYIRDCKGIEGSMKPLLEKHGFLCFMSTPRKILSDFGELVRMAQNGERGWELLRLPWHSRPDRDEKWAEGMKRDLSPEDWRREYGLEFLSEGSEVLFPDFNEKYHLVETEPYEFKTVRAGREKASPVYCAIDPHVTKATAVLWMAVLPNDDWVFLKTLWTRKTVPDVVKLMQAIESDWRVVDRVMDPSGNAPHKLGGMNPVAQQFRDAGMPVRTATRDRLGIIKLQDRMKLQADGKPKMYVCRAASKLIDNIRQASIETDSRAEKGGDWDFIDCAKYIANCHPSYDQTPSIDPKSKATNPYYLEMLENVLAGTRTSEEMPWTERAL